MSILNKLGKAFVFIDGGMGTMLQAAGLSLGQPPEIYNIVKSETVINVHRQYIRAGADIITTNTFGAYNHKFDNLEQIISSAILNVKKAALIENACIATALDMGPTGKMLKPLGNTEFKDCYEIFKQTAVTGAKYGADLVILETFSDTYEAKAAILSIKENTDLPIFCTMTFDEHGKTLTGGDILTMVSLLEGLGVTALGINCGLGPYQIEQLLPELVKYASLPIMLQPNAGLPTVVNGDTQYDLTPPMFAASMAKMAKMGAVILGGCCGTTPAHIEATKQACHTIKPVETTNKNYCLVSSYGKTAIIGERPLIVGERINPTGRKAFKQALLNHDMDIILNEAINQKNAGAHILDVNVGLPEIDEAAYMEDALTSIQAICDLPLQIDSSSPDVLDRAMRLYNGKPLVNSVTGKAASMAAVFPLIKKYGGVVIGLALDEDGIPVSIEKRIEIAEKIVKTAETYGISNKNIVIDALTLTVSAQQKESAQTLFALKAIKERFGVKTILGVSNVSFGIPQRDLVNATFLAMALSSGLDLCIINPLAPLMKGVFNSYSVLANHDKNCEEFISIYQNSSQNFGAKPSAAVASKSDTEGKTAFSSLSDNIIKGLKEAAYAETKNMLLTLKPLEIINDHLVTALDFVGNNYETGRMFLPQLIMSAEAAKRTFDAIRENMALSGEKSQPKGKILLATVEGDSHDIGKNIVSALLENYGYEIVDLGKDVPVNAVVKTAIDGEFKLVGLSALMTTTVVSMERTIKAIKDIKPDCLVMVGGAVLNEDYANMIKADYYAKDALGAVAIAKKVFGQ